MAKWSMPRLFEACYGILVKQCQPIHYRALTEQALEAIGVSPAQLSLLDKKRAWEDVREKMLEANRFGTFYVRKPYYMAGLRDWFGGCFNFEPHWMRVAPNLRVSIHACTEALLRAPHMIQKVRNCDQKRRWAGLARGQMVEHHVSHYFRSNWPLLYREPDNEGQYDLWCDHDFKLLVNERLYLVDAMGPRVDGLFGMPLGGGKRRVHLHILASPSDDGVIIHGFRTGADLDTEFAAEQCTPITRLVVRLNCIKAGINYEYIKQAAFGEKLLA